MMPWASEEGGGNVIAIGELTEVSESRVSLRTFNVLGGMYMTGLWDTPMMTAMGQEVVVVLVLVLVV